MADAITKQKVLRAKYLDWCSARLADSFLVLPPDEIYEMAEQASRNHAGTHGTLVDTPAAAPMLLPDADSDSFRTLVALVTEVLAERLNLPSFESWAADYEKAPHKYDDELLGFWKQETQS